MAASLSLGRGERLRFQVPDTGVLRNRIWRRPNEDPPPASCSICDHEQEDLRHFVFLCPSKKEVWITILAEYSTKPHWTDDELSSLVSLNCRLIRPKPQFNITALQITASILLSIWGLHWAFIFDETPISTVTGLSMARRHISTLTAQNNYRKERVPQ
jgi:hypothetical protein